MATFGAITFDGVVGQVTARTTKTVAPVDNPAQVHAAERRVGQFRPSTLLYNGFFTTPQQDALEAMIGSVVEATDETGSTHTVLVVDVQPREVPARHGGTDGWWTEATASVQDWAA